MDFWYRLDKSKSIFISLLDVWSLTTSILNIVNIVNNVNIVNHRVTVSLVSVVNVFNLFILIFTGGLRC